MMQSTPRSNLGSGQASADTPASRSGFGASAGAVFFFLWVTILLPRTLISSPEKVFLKPRFAAGQSLRYRFDLRNTIAGHITGPIAYPGAPSRLEETSVLVLKVDVLDVQAGTGAGPGPVFLRVTCEESSAKFETDAYDPQAATLEEQLRGLKGTSQVFMLERDGAITAVNDSGVAALQSIPGASLREELTSLVTSAAYPPKGVSLGEKWSAETPLDGLPLAGIVSYATSTYLRDEPCRTSEVAATGAENCAVVRTQTETRQRHLPDATPDEYRHNSLKTQGKWSRTSETLETISRRTGFLVSATQDSAQEMKFEVVSNISGSRLDYAGDVESRSQITFLSGQEK